MLHQELSTSLNVIHQQIKDSDEKESKEEEELGQELESPPSSTLLPLTATEFVSSFNQPINNAKYSSHDLQSRLTMKAQAKIRLASLRVARDAARNERSTSALTNHSRILAVAAPGASTWVATTAFDAATTIPNDAYKSAVRLRLGLAPRYIMPNDCYSCHIYSRQNSIRCSVPFWTCCRVLLLCL